MTSSMRGRAIVLGLVVVVAAGVVFVVTSSGLFGPAASSVPSGSQAASGSSATPADSGSSLSPEPGSQSPEVTPSPTPAPTPVNAVAPLDGLLTTPAKAKLHPIAVMIDDLSPARPQSGFSSASVVWQAPAEGGIPRYMMIFQENTPPADVGPVRSARYYFIAWAAEWRAAYVHAGGSPQALATLRTKGKGQYVFDANQFYNGAYFRRVTTRFPPHNLYTTGKQLRQLASKVKATAAPPHAVWRFAPDAPLEKRPVGGTIETDYLANRIIYKYDRATNTYPRYVTGGTRQVDPATKKPVAPKNVVVMLMKFAPLNDGSNHHRLEATVVGSGTAWIATNGHTIKGKWRKKSITAPTLFFDAAGHQVTLTAGQTFVQVMKTTDVVKIKDGKVPPAPSPSPSPSPSGSIGSPGLEPAESPSQNVRRPDFGVMV